MALATFTWQAAVASSHCSAVNDDPATVITHACQSLSEATQLISNFTKVVELSNQQVSSCIVHLLSTTYSADCGSKG